MAELGWIASSIEPCMWKLLDETGSIIDLAIVHIDDFLIALPEGAMLHAHVAAKALADLKAKYE